MTKPRGNGNSFANMEIESVQEISFKPALYKSPKGTSGEGYEVIL